MPGDYGGEVSSAATSGSGWLSGLSGLFSTVGTVIAQDYRAVSTPTGVITTPAQGGLVFNPQTGTYVPVGGLSSTLGGNSSLFLIAGLVLVVLVLRR